MKKLTINGDTIVEVVISIAILSLILTGAYTTTNKSLIDERDAQERSIALQIVQGQIEQIKAIYTANTVSIPSSAFCINNSITPQPVPDLSDNCNFDISGNNGATAEPYYNIVTNSSTVPTGILEITVTATWISVTGNGNDNLEMVYQLN